MFYDIDHEFNRYTNLDSVEWRIIDALVKSDSKYAKMLWRMLKYNNEDCLFGDELTNQEKYKLVYRSNGESSKYKVFMLPFIDDGWTEQSARLNIYVSRVSPENYVSSKVDVTLEIIVHNKINNIIGDADDPEEAKPNEVDEDGNVLIPTKSRVTTILKCVLAVLNGLAVEGVGVLQCNEEVSPYCGVRSYVWNNRSYFGYSVTFSTIMGQVSSPPCGW